MLSVNTNYGASVALQNLNRTGKELDEVQSRINTGLKVAGAKDNGAVFAMAQGQRARMTALASVRDGIDRATATIDVALSAGNKVGEILQQMKTKAVAAQAGDLTSDQRAAIQADYDELRAGINQIANAAQFNGMNLVASGGANLSMVISDLNTGTTGRQVQSTAIAGYVPGMNSYIVNATSAVAIADDTRFNLNGVQIGQVDITATMTVADYIGAVNTATGGRVTANYNQANGQFTYVAAEAVVGTNELTVTSAGTARSWLGQGVAATAVSASAVTANIVDLDFTVGGSGALSTLTMGSNVLSTAAAAATVSANIDTALTTMSRQLATLGSQAKALDIQNDFLSSLSDTIEKGIGNLVDADLAKESARLQALQIKQQLGAQALSIANQSPSIVLSFFR
jgi:flagellin